MNRLLFIIYNIVVVIYSIRTSKGRTRAEVKHGHKMKNIIRTTLWNIRIRNKINENTPYPLSNHDCSSPLKYLDTQLLVNIEVLSDWLYRTCETEKTSFMHQYKGEDETRCYYRTHLDKTKIITDNVKILALVIKSWGKLRDDEFKIIWNLDDYAIWLFELRKLSEEKTQLIIFWGAEFNVDELFNHIVGIEDYLLRILDSVLDNFEHGSDKVGNHQNENNETHESVVIDTQDQLLPHDPTYKKIIQLSNSGKTSREILQSLAVSYEESSINKIIHEGRKYLGPSNVTYRGNRKKSEEE